jgi:uncharacterized membrane protein
MEKSVLPEQLRGSDITAKFLLKLHAFLIFSVFSISQAAVSTNRLIFPRVGQATATRTTTDPDPIFVTVGNFVGNHISQAFLFGLLLIITSCFLSYYASEVWVGISVSIIASVGLFVGSVKMRNYSTLQQPAAYWLSSLVIGVLYGCIGALVSEVIRSSLVRD